MPGLIAIAIFILTFIFVVGTAEERLRRFVERRYGVMIQTGYRNSWTIIGEVDGRQRFTIHAIHMVGMILALLLTAAIVYVAIALLAQVTGNA